MASFLLPHSLFSVPFGLAFMGFSFLFARDLVAFLFALPFFLIGFFVSFGGLITGLMSQRNTEYIITDQRVMVQTGAFHVNTIIISLDTIQDVSIRIGLVDNRYGTGTVYIQASEGPFFGTSLRSLKEPYLVQELISDAINNLHPGAGFTGGQF